MKTFVIFSVSVFVFYLSVYNCMLSVEDGFPRRRDEDVTDFHFCNSLMTRNVRVLSSMPLYFDLSNVVLLSASLDTFSDS